MELLQTSFTPVTTSDTPQGITKDDTYFYFTTHNNIYKIPIAGGTVVSRTTSGDGDTDVKHQNDLVVKGDYLYVATNNFDVNPNGPYKSYVKVFNKSDLTYVEQHEVSTSVRISCIVDMGTYFVLGGGMSEVFYKWNTDLDTLLDTFDCGDLVISGHGWNGITFVKGQFYCNIHDSSYPSTIQVFDYDETNFEFTYVSTVDRPLNCGQGLQWIDNVMYFARREYSGTFGSLDKGIVTAQLLPYDNRRERIAVRSLPATQTISSTSYGTISGTGAELFARQHDIIRVDHSLIGYVSASTCDLTVKIMPHSSSAGNVYEMYDGEYASARTSKTNSEGETLYMAKYYRVKSDGFHKFNVEAKKSGSGTGYTGNHTTFVQIIGRATE